jgi:ribulose 1,5-bisphosphate carboxylase large subunit-like protein
LYKIDRAIALKPPLSAEVLKKVIALRDEGEKLHRQEKHGEAMLVLGSAKRLLGID